MSLDGKKEEITNTKKLVDFASMRASKSVISKSDSHKVISLIPINGHHESIDITSNKAIAWLKSSYYDEFGLIYSNETYKNALDLFYSLMIFSQETPEESVYKRVAQTNDTIYYDLCNRDWEAVKITREKIEIVKLGLATPMFLRTRRNREQVKPIINPNVDALSQLIETLKIPEPLRKLFKIHIISFFLEGYPMPIMAITGEQGSIKSTITQSIKRIVDPSGDKFEDNTNKMPEETDDLNLAIYSNYCSAFDNISSFSHETSDDLCRAVTGQLYTKRELYTNTDEILLAFKRKIILNGIAPNLENGDLLERTIIYQVDPIPEDQRITLKEYEKQFNTLLPHILGQIFTILQKALELYPTLEGTLKQLPRMSDFSVWGEAISQAMGNEPNEFLELYRTNLSSNYMDAAEAHAIVEYIAHLAETCNFPIKSRVSDFYNDLKRYAIEHNYDVNSTYSIFPKYHNKLKTHVKRVNPFIRNAGFDVKIYRYNKRDESKLHGNMIIEVGTLQKKLFQSGEDGEDS
jgi:hypothetical protein